MASALELRVSEVKELVITVDARLAAAQKTIDEHKKSHADNFQALADLRRECEKQIAVLDHKVEELRKSADTTGGRVFTIVLTIGSAILGASLALGGNALLRLWFVR
jgi:hypothetical protein